MCEVFGLPEAQSRYLLQQISGKLSVKTVVVRDES